MRPYHIFWQSYQLAYRVAKSLFVSTGLMNTPIRRTAGALDKLLRLVIFAPAARNPAIVAGLIIHYPRNDYHWAPEWATGTYEQETTSLMQRILSPGMTFVDVGAHIGYYTLLASRLVGPEGKVYSFEPNPCIRQYLSKNIEVNGYDGVVAVMPQAVGSVVGRRSLFLGRGSTVYTSLFPNHSTEAAHVDVEMTTLDDFFLAGGRPHIDLMKMDIEGAEHDALKGMTVLSRNNPGLRLVVEFNLENIRAALIGPEDLFTVLRDCGFTSFYIIDSSSLQQVNLPGDLPRLLRLASHSPPNLLCIKEGGS